jgi:hypothetical protein
LQKGRAAAAAAAAPAAAGSAEAAEAAQPGGPQPHQLRDCTGSDGDRGQHSWRGCTVLLLHSSVRQRGSQASAISVPAVLARTPSAASVPMQFESPRSIEGVTAYTPFTGVFNAIRVCGSTHQNAPSSIYIIRDFVLVTSQLPFYRLCFRCWRFAAVGGLPLSTS